MKNKSFPTLEKVVQIISDGHAEEANNMAFFETLCTVLAKFEGKFITGKFCVAVRNYFGPDTYCVMNHLSIRIPSISLYGPKVPGHSTYETRFTFSLPLHDKSEQPFTVANLREANVCYCEAAKERNDHRASASEATIRRAAIAIDNFLAAQAELKESLAGLEDRYAIEHAFKLCKD